MERIQEVSSQELSFLGWQNLKKFSVHVNPPLDRTTLFATTTSPLVPLTTKLTWTRKINGKDVNFSVTIEAGGQSNNVRVALIVEFSENGISILKGSSSYGELIITQSSNGRNTPFNAQEKFKLATTIRTEDFYLANGTGFQFKIIRIIDPKVSLDKGLKMYLSRQEMEHTSDLEIKAGDKTLRCHKVILARGSKVIEAMLKLPFEEKETGIIKINDFNEDTVENFLDFMYLGELDDERYTVELLGMANKYDALSLIHACAVHLPAFVSKDNVAQLWIASDKCNLSELKASVLDFIGKHWSLRSEIPEINDVIKHNPEYVYDLVTHVTSKLASGTKKIC